MVSEGKAELDEEATAVELEADLVRKGVMVIVVRKAFVPSLDDFIVDAAEMLGNDIAAKATSFSAFMQAHVGNHKCRCEHIELHDGIHVGIEFVFRQPLLCMFQRH
ncbi:hypothetical protein [Bradyrhizobium sp. SZCCHNR3107]|uniref:hypothetical protein n=1 Tax=Bradyrhizobium sp. SZCCHNR3107 TaxID=3057459 RepID=UPI0028E487A3|nr:hypothetical protein [Bradyrhizobium sp. SZCCHNR3107]